MRLAFLQLRATEREPYFQQAALRRSLQPAIMEKDFWVCWLLSLLFAHPEFKDALVFKGGTSLSKVFGMIQRFSEDLDLSISPEFLDVAEDEGERVSSRTQLGRWMEHLREACAVAVKERLQPELEREIVDALGQRSGGAPWTEFTIDADSQVVLFHYPVTQSDGYPYLQQTVKMEFGSLTSQRPTGRHVIVPWVAEEFPNTFSDWHCELTALEVERTYWEKATILHAEHHRPPDRPMPVRYARHYSDFAAMALHPAARGALARDDLREEVVTWKERFFRQAWARYDLARPGTFLLVPPPSRISELESDYAAMRDMFIATPPPFAEMLATLTEQERAINGDTVT